MIHVTSSVDVDRAADEVFAFVADASNNPSWQQGMRSCEWTSEPPIDVGSTYDQEASFLGRPIVSSFVVTALEPGRSLTITTTSSTFPITVTRSVAPLGDDRCRVTADVRGGPEGLAAILDPLTRRMVQRSVRGDYARLRLLLSRP